ncbi:phytanoyl-CoA dioxygenase family protein [Aeromicrobium stalagmiti]|uniref:phytanoyl-CoA dioxygenase family protein n=1 Tax=Aeromicrobium stalagmiti TaxID=2738988 RepID=UPI00156801D5|nr:phytanoyl-CoA dioxygenase family protein [Aeromicrobium stalagmiti]NRQ49448.1 phytanoyl-CoA dioxygenase family protein [Aeromicrobium stalagmiti]
MTLVDEQTVEDYRRDGVVCVRGLLDPDEVEWAREAVADVLEAPGPLAQVASGADDPGFFIEDFRRWRDLPAIGDLALHSRAGQVAAELMRSPTVRLFHDHVLVKEGGTTQRTPWHQDQPYYNVDGRGVSAWIPVDPVPEGGCLELVAATHRGPWLMPRTFLDGEARWFPEGSLQELPDIEADRAAYDIRRFEMEPGDAIFFDFLTVHGAPGFPFAGRRRVLSLRYLSAEARHAPRHWRTSPPFDGLVDELDDGASMDHPLFPVVWPA